MLHVAGQRVCICSDGDISRRSLDERHNNMQATPACRTDGLGDSDAGSVSDGLGDLDVTPESAKPDADWRKAKRQ